MFKPLAFSLDSFLARPFDFMKVLIQDHWTARVKCASLASRVVLACRERPHDVLPNRITVTPQRAVPS